MLAPSWSNPQQSALAQNIQINTSELGQAFTSMNKSLRLAISDVPLFAGQDQLYQLMQLSITKQAMFISYINKFYALALLTLAFIPIVWLAKYERPLL